ncbi:DUF6253 family protein [Streptomyces sp. NPDC058662]|uniref:DUF6253 family protein n=1 Tax=Streptomyces sp. NPDC058662 TaxID=3346583 RepID=UPI003656CD56
MSLLAADGHAALCRTPEGDSYRIPLVCWRDDGSAVYGMVLHRGSLRRAEQVPGFRRYTDEHAPGTPAGSQDARERPERYADLTG